MNLYKVTFKHIWSETGAFEYYSAKSLDSLCDYVENKDKIVNIEYLGKVKIAKELVNEQ